MSTLQRIFEKGALACACKLAQYEVRAGVRSSHPLKNKMNLRSESSIFASAPPEDGT
jgi:hypothetical protein